MVLPLTQLILITSAKHMKTFMTAALTQMMTRLKNNFGSAVCSIIIACFLQKE